jgi:hypothetical protein
MKQNLKLDNCFYGFKGKSSIAKICKNSIGSTIFKGLDFCRNSFPSTEISVIKSSKSLSQVMIKSALISIAKFKYGSSFLSRDNSKCLPTKRPKNGFFFNMFKKNNQIFGRGVWKFCLKFRSAQYIFDFIENITTDIKLDQFVINQFLTFTGCAFCGKKCLQINIAIKNDFCLFACHLFLLLFLPDFFAQIVNENIQIIFAHSAFFKILPNRRKNLIKRRF